MNRTTITSLNLNYMCIYSLLIIIWDQRSVPCASPARPHGQHLHQRRHQRRRRARGHGPRGVGAPDEARGDHHDESNDDDKQVEAAASFHGLPRRNERALGWISSEFQARSTSTVYLSESLAGSRDANGLFLFFSLGVCARRRFDASQSSACVYL